MPVTNWHRPSLSSPDWSGLEVLHPHCTDCDPVRVRRLLDAHLRRPSVKFCSLHRDSSRVHGDCDYRVRWKRQESGDVHRLCSVFVDLRRPCHAAWARATGSLEHMGQQATDNPCDETCIPGLPANQIHGRCDRQTTAKLCTETE